MPRVNNHELATDFYKIETRVRNSNNRKKRRAIRGSARIRIDISAMLAFSLRFLSNKIIINMTHGYRGRNVAAKARRNARRALIHAPLPGHGPSNSKLCIVPPLCYASRLLSSSTLAVETSSLSVLFPAVSSVDISLVLSDVYIPRLVGPLAVPRGIPRRILLRRRIGGFDPIRSNDDRFVCKRSDASTRVE